MNEHPDIELLHATLAGELSDEQEAIAKDHLDQCPQCCKRLEEIAAGGDEAWSRIAGVLRLEAKSQRSAGETSLSRLYPHDSCSQSASPVYPCEYAQSPVDFAISFLGPSDRSDAIGRLGEFEILSVIGFGGMGIVLKGFQTELNRPVAVKVMAPHLATSGAARSRFLREAQATAAIVHPNVMPILSVSEKAALPFLVMPFVACHSLQQRIDSDGALAVVDVLRISLQVAEGLAAAHAQGLVLLVATLTIGSIGVHHLASSPQQSQPSIPATQRLSQQSTGELQQQASPQAAQQSAQNVAVETTLWDDELDSQLRSLNDEIDQLMHRVESEL